MRFQVLGPLSVVGDAGCVELRPSKLNSLLAALLLRAGQGAPLGYLSDAVWDADAPDASKAALHTAILRLRRLFAGLGFAPDLIATTPQGYRLLTGGADLDLVAFRSARAAAEDIVDPRGRRDALRAALSMWSVPPTRAEPLLNVPSETLRRDVVPVLIEEWKQTAERCFDLELALGDPRPVLSDLREATVAFPTHEGFARQLADGLWRAQRQHEALAEIRRIKELLRDELGLTPGEHLRALELDILRGEPPARLPALHLVPDDTTSGPSLTCPDLRRLRDRADSDVRLVGRTEELALLDAVMGVGPGGGIVVISGPPGIGKSAVAAAVIRAAGERFPGGIDYRCGCHHVEADGALPVPARLVVVENAGDTAAEDYRELARRGSRVLLISRYCHRDLPADHGVVGVRLRPLPADEALALACRLIDGAAQDRGAMATLAELTSGFPSAITLAAGRLRLSRDRDIRCFVNWLGQDPVRRLSASRDPRASIVLSFDEHVSTLRPGTRSAFLALSAAADGEISLPQAAEVLMTDEVEAELALEDLVDACLADVDSAGHYSIPPLARAVAACLARPAPTSPIETRHLVTTTTADRRRA